MSMYRRKPNPQMLIQYPGDADKFVTKREDGTCFVWNAKSKSEVNIEPGDFINITNLEDIYPIKPDVVAANFEEVK